MCGIAGIIASDPARVTPDRIKAMTDVIAHRGPDGEGCWIDTGGQVGLGHRRLSIIDLSHEADQPMHYLDRYTLVFNGEIYNYIELREQLKKQGYVFRTQSDTEVLIALYDRDRQQCLQHLDGMFAFALYDAAEKTVFCARDRFGEKPFFYSHKPGAYFYFGSEMKCLWAGGIDKEINGRMLFNYLSFGYIENPQDLSETFFRNCTRLEHSHYLLLQTDTLTLTLTNYYQLEWQNINYSITIQQARETLNELFYTSVQRRLRSDVAVGSSLSGGLDSSLVVCVIDDLKKGTHQKQHTFSAVFPGYEKDETKFIDYVTAACNVQPHYVSPGNEGLLQELDTLCYHQEEPFVSASIYAQYCVMGLAKEHQTTVLLDGQGADEILAGYHHYYLPFFREIRGTSGFASQLASYNTLHQSNPINGLTTKTMGDRIRSVSPALIKPVKQLRNAYRQLSSPVFNPDFYRQYKGDVFETPGNSYSTLNEALYQSTMKYGLQQLLRYADRNSMAHSREVRLPFLYHELVAFLFTLPASYKINEGWTKWIMRESFALLPDAIRWRKDKIGYEPPQKKWMEDERISDQLRLVMNSLSHKNILAVKKGKFRSVNNEMDWRILLSGTLD